MAIHSIRTIIHIKQFSPPPRPYPPNQSSVCLRICDGGGGGGRDEHKQFAVYMSATVSHFIIVTTPKLYIFIPQQF